MNNWCVHIRKDSQGISFIIAPGLGQNIMYEDWQFCPVCGTKRPEVKSLEQELTDLLYGNCSLKVTSEEAAKIIINFLKFNNLLKDPLE